MLPFRTVFMVLCLSLVFTNQVRALATMRCDNSEHAYSMTMSDISHAGSAGDFRFPTDDVHPSSSHDDTADTGDSFATDNPQQPMSCCMNDCDNCALFGGGLGLPTSSYLPLNLMDTPDAQAKGCDSLPNPAQEARFRPPIF